MANRPQLTGRDVTEIFEAAGFTADRQTGSHVTMRNDDGASVTVAGHGNKPIKTGTLAGMFNQVAAALPPEAAEVLAQIREGGGNHKKLVKQLATLTQG